MSTNTCVVCGAEIPEGRQVCPICMASVDNHPGPCVACRYAERIRRNKLRVFCHLRGVEVPILHTCDYGDRKTEKEIKIITNHYKTERKDKK